MLISFCIIVHAIEVGGHLTEDTTWSPASNPYEVMEILYVDSGVTLTILPGTEIKISGASLTSYYEYEQNFWLDGSGWSLAKFIQVDGRIIAEGTEQDSIIFTRLQDDIDFNWGSIYITYDAELCLFKYCMFEHMGNIGIQPSVVSEGLDFFNGRGKVNNCKFLNCTVGINSDSYEKELEIIDNAFTIDDGVNLFLPEFNPGKNFIMSSRIGTYVAKDVLICNNVFNGYGSYHGFSVEQMSLAYNTLSDCLGSGGANYFYDNDFLNSGVIGYNYDSLYIKINRFIDGGIDLDYAYVEICDNYFEESGIDTDLECSGKIYNNVIRNGNVRTSAYLDVFQNIGFNGQSGITITYRNESCFNNLSYNNEYAFNGVFSDYYNNCIFLNNEELSQNGVHGNPIFRNCIIDFPLDPPLVDGGGNIIVDSLQAQLIFTDIQNGDFHLAMGSIAIDAGFDTLGYYYPFDLDYNQRVWDGDNNGTAIIDIGPYEYGAPAFGGIEGITYNPLNGNPVDYVLIKINNEPGEFTFSDSAGYYQYKLPAGIYDVYAERVFYDDAVEYQIEVIDGVFTQLDIAMYEIVSTDEPIIPNSSFQISDLSNYPNPFNPSTIISFSIQNDSKVNLTIFNIKGQKIKTLINDQLPKGKHSIIWSCLDSNNKPVSSGIYLYKVKAGNQESVNRMLLLK